MSPDCCDHHSPHHWRADTDGSDPAQVKFVQSYYRLLRALQDYIKRYYPSGLIWNANGVDALQAMKEVADERSAGTPHAAEKLGDNAAANGAPPPPPPPPPLPVFDNLPPPQPAASDSGSGDMDAVFAQLNRGSDVTKGLKKVDKSQMTHKNPALRASSTVPDTSRSRSRGPETKPKPASMRQSSSTSTVTKKEGKKELDGNKWLVENYDSPSTPLELEVSLAQSVLISRCIKTTIILKGKANAVSIDNSPRCQVLVDNLVSSVDVIKSPNFAVQVTGSLPTIMLDQVDGASIYLSTASLGTEVFTSKCSGINIILPPTSNDADSTEHALPEQIRSFIKDGKVINEIVEHAG